MDDEPRRERSPVLRVLLAGGGTGGHVFPALAVGEALAGRGWEVAWVGREDGMEARLVRSRGMAFHALGARPLVGRGTAARLGALVVLARSALAARRLVRRVDARVVLGTGGYASAGAVLGARLARRPVLLLEPNVRAGFANRWLSRWAQGAAVAYRETGDDLRCPTHLTGVPVRPEFVAAALPPSPPLRLLVLGGSQGALQLNRLLPAALAACRAGSEPLRVLHQVGEPHLEAARAAWTEAATPGVEVEVVAFLDDVAAAMTAAHLVISRAGAVTLAEICAAGRPAILVPLAIAGGHQEANARGLVEAGAARLVAGEEATPQGLARHLDELLGAPALLASMSDAACALGRPGAAAAIADLVESLAEAA